MRTVEEIKKDIKECSATGTQKQLDEYWFEWFRCLVISNEISPDRLAEICAADKDGRLLVLPCKVGDTVYFVADGAVKETRLLAIKANVSDPAYSGNPSIIYEGYFQIGMHVMCWSIGNRLYLTRAEAEAALAS